jgi:hypothetical protein
LVFLDVTEKPPLSLFPSIFRAGLGWLGLAGPAVAVADDAQAAAADKPLKPAK